MRICIDSNQFIFGLSGSDVASETVLKLLPRLEVVIPRLIIKEEFLRLYYWAVMENQ